MFGYASRLRLIRWTEAAEALAGRGSKGPLGSLLDGHDGERTIRSSVTAPAGSKHLLRIWLAGVTHEDSAKLREVEAKQATGQAINVYDQKYRECAEGGIPELFAKTDPDSCVAHCQPIGLTKTPSRIRLLLLPINRRRRPKTIRINIRKIKR